MRVDFAAFLVAGGVLAPAASANWSRVVIGVKSECMSQFDACKAHPKPGNSAENPSSTHALVDTPSSKSWTGQLHVSRRGAGAGAAWPPCREGAMGDLRRAVATQAACGWSWGGCKVSPPTPALGQAIQLLERASCVEGS